MLHWDSKILPDITGKSKVYRLPVVVTALNMEQLLGVPEIKSGTGGEISSALYHTLQEWSLEDTIQAFVFDTTAIGVPPQGIHFRAPGAYHLARWMAKAIYCLKIFLFRTQFKLTQKQEKSLKRICCFIMKCYAEAWFSSTNAITAPMNDIYFLKTLNAYKMDDKEVAEKAISKIINHLWYLNEESAAFSIFDERINNETQMKMA
ncbi:Uncharacterized protein FWK35_00031556, partial [Aphis craccivora]